MSLFNCQEKKRGGIHFDSSHREKHWIQVQGKAGVVISVLFFFLQHNCMKLKKKKTQFSYKTSRDKTLETNRAGPWYSQVPSREAFGELHIKDLSLDAPWTRFISTPFYRILSIEVRVTTSLLLPLVHIAIWINVVMQNWKWPSVSSQSSFLYDASFPSLKIYHPCCLMLIVLEPPNIRGVDSGSRSDRACLCITHDTWKN